MNREEDSTVKSWVIGKENTRAARLTTYSHSKRHECHANKVKQVVPLEHVT
jgi:hypothetical protein